MEDIIDIIVTETTNLIEITSQPTDEIIDVNIIDNREDVVLNVTPTVVEININSLTGNFGVNWGDITGTLANQTDLQNTLNLKADLVGGKVPSSQLPSYVDDVVEVSNYASLPTNGETGKIYITLDTNFMYRWSGSTYIEIKDSSAVWGAITGTLSNQTDLQNALNSKEPLITSGTTSQYYRGDKTFQTLNTSAVTEGTNLYYLDTRARGAISAGTGISYNSGTGVITNTITQYTDALARGAISLTTTGANGSATYNSTTGVLNVPSYTLSGLGGQPLAGNLTALAGLSYSSLGFIKMTGVGTLALDTNTYLTTSSASSTYLALGGGTMTGSLIGTSAGFTGYVGIGNTSPLYQLDVTGSGRFEGDLRILSSNPRIYLTDSDNNPDYFISNTDGTFTVYDVTNSTSRFTIGTTGNATFTNAITGGGSITGQSLYSNGIISAGTTISAQGAFFDNGATTSIIQFNQSGTLKARLYFNTTPNTLTLGTYNTGGNLRFEVDNNTPAVTIASTGVTTFNYALSGTSASFTTLLNVNSAGTEMVNINNVDNSAKQGIRLNNGINSSSGIVLFNSSSSTGTDTGGFLRVHQTSTSLAQPSAVFRQDGSADILQLQGAAGAVRLTIASTGAATFSSSVTATSLQINGVDSSGVKVFIDTAVNGLPATSGTSQSNGALRLRGGDNAVLDFGLNSTNTWIQATDRSSLGTYYNILLNPRGGNVGIGTTAPTNLLTLVSSASGKGIDFVSYANFANVIGQIDFNQTTDNFAIYNKINGAIVLGTNNTERMRITSGGNVGINITNPSALFQVNLQNGTAGNNIAIFGDSAGSTYTLGVIIQNVNSVSYNNTNTGIKVGSNTGTGRSINAGGTINAMGLDYAEYMTKSTSENINKGDIVGIDSNGLLTDLFELSISFGIKSTNPSFVGGDKWGADKEDTNLLEQERQKVDRIAFSGQVPCNILKAKVGDYIIPINVNGKIKGQAVTNPTFEQYQISVGKVWKIMEDGRAWVAVKIG